MKNRYVFTLDGFVGAPRAQNIRPLVPADVSALAHLMLEAYRDTIDYEGETLEETVGLLQQTLRDGTDPMSGGQHLRACSFALDRHGTLLSACLLSLWRETPLISAIMVHPEYKGQGIARQVLSASMSALKEAAYPSVLAFITEGNTASERLFERFGFEHTPRES